MSWRILWIRVSCDRIPGIQSPDYVLRHRCRDRIKEKHNDLYKQLKNTKKNLKDEIEKAYKSDYFFCIYNKIIKRQLNKSVVE
jgi:hypothetical protein